MRNAPKHWTCKQCNIIVLYFWKSVVWIEDHYHFHACESEILSRKEFSQKG